MKMNIRQRDDIIIKPTGLIIGPAYRNLRMSIDAQLDTPSDGPKLLFDFADVPRMDSAGLGELVAIYVLVARRGGRIAVINVAERIHNMIVMAKLIAVFEHFDSEDEAIDALIANDVSLPID